MPPFPPEFVGCTFDYAKMTTYISRQESGCSKTRYDQLNVAGLKTENNYIKQVYFLMFN